MSHQTEARRVAWRGWRLTRGQRRPTDMTVRWFKPHPGSRSVPTALCAYAVFAVVLGFPGALKLVKAYHVAEGRVGAADLVRVVSADVAFALASMAATLILGRLLKHARFGAWLFGVATTLYLLIVLLLTALEHQAWVRSSSLLDWSIFWYSIEHYRELKPIVAAET